MVQNSKQSRCAVVD